MKNIFIGSKIINIKTEDHNEYIENYVYNDFKLAEKEHPELTFYEYERNEKTKQYIIKLPF